MTTFLIALGGIAVLIGAIRFVIGRQRTRELDRDFTLELSCARNRALLAAAAAARGVLWEVQLTDDGLRTRHVKTRNVIHVAISDLAGHTGRSNAKVWTRCTWADAVLFLRPSAYIDTRRKRDKIIRALAAYQPKRPNAAPIH